MISCRSGDRLKADCRRRGARSTCEASGVVGAAFLPVGCGPDFIARERKEMRLDVVSESARKARPLAINQYAQKHFSRTGRDDAGLFAVVNQASNLQFVRNSPREAHGGDAGCLFRS